MDLESYRQEKEIIEGILSCKKCGLVYPIIQKVAIMWNDFAIYLSNRQKLGGELLLGTKNTHLKSMIKSALAKASKSQDISIIEKRWTGIYRNNQRSNFYGLVKKSLPNADVALEHGCSIGIVSRYMARKAKTVFGIDKSFYAILEAKKSYKKNLDYFVADSMESPFGKAGFDLVLGLNLFELVEPKKLLLVLVNHIKKGGTLILTDPYDYDRGTKSVKEPLYEDTIRKEIAKLGFTITSQTKKPSHIPWNLNLHGRATLQYLVDFIIATKS